MTGLTDAEREALLTPCGCGHTINDHGSLCWVCADDGRPTDCTTDFEALLVERVAGIVGDHGRPLVPPLPPPCRAHPARSRRAGGRR